MAPSEKRKASSHKQKRVSKSDIERLICKRKLDALEQEEAQIKEDRFSTEEKRILLDAYNEQGYHVFQNIQLLHKYLPQRKESDLKILIQRLRASLSTETQKEPLDDWQRLCHQLMGNFAKDKKVNFDDLYADALTIEANKLPSLETTDDLKINQSDVLRSFAQLLLGKFPDNVSAGSAHVSMKLFEHVNEIVDSLDIKSALPSLLDGSWLESAWGVKRRRLEMASKGLEDMKSVTKRGPSYKDITKNPNIEALCLELPKIKRIVDVLNPLCVETLNSKLIDKLNL